MFLQFPIAAKNSSRRDPKSIGIPVFYHWLGNIARSMKLDQILQCDTYGINYADIYARSVEITHSSFWP